MKHLYVDCQAGISGDMTVAALLDLGVPLEHLREMLARMPLPRDNYTLTEERVVRHGVPARKFDVLVHDRTTDRRYREIDQMVAGSTLPERAGDLARRIFRRLAAAESLVHGVPVDEVHFHEVGAIDSIVDIVATAVGLEFLGVERVSVSPLPLGRGFVQTAHGRLPVPAPATLELLRGLEVHDRCGEGERVTPTGAAIVAELAAGSPVKMTLEKTGIGAGSHDFSDCPNVLRLLLGRASGGGRDEVIEICCNIDDQPPELIGYAQEVLLEQGALDVWVTPVQMKKGRPGMVLSLLAAPADHERLAALVMRETGTLGVRYRRLERIIQSRYSEQRETPFGPVWFKVGEYGEKPEFEECRRIARERGLSCREVMVCLARGDKP